MRKGKLTIDNFSGGWSNDFAKNASISAPQSRANTYYMGLFNINKSNYLGQIHRPIGNNPNVTWIDSLAINATKTSNNYATFICTSGTLPEISTTHSFPLSPSYWAAPSGCTSDEYKDIWTHMFYNAGSPKECTFFTYQTSTQAYIGYKFPGTVTGRVDTFQTLANLNVPHVGCVSNGNLSYITDGNWVRTYNPDNGDYNSGINLGVGYTARSLTDFGNYCAIVGDNGVNARMWLWNGTSENANFQYEIRDGSVTAIVNEGGELRVFTYGKNNTTKIKTFNGNGFSEEADWEVPTSLCTSPKHGMTDVWLNQIVWRTPDGYLWTYGSPRKNELQSGAHRVGLIDTDTNSNGCVKNLYQDRLFISMTNAGSNYICEVLGTNPYASTKGDLNIKTCLYTLPHKSTIKVIHVFFSKLTFNNPDEPSKIYFNLYSGYGTIDYLQNITIPAPATAQDFTYFPITKSIPEIDTFYLNITQSVGGVPLIIKKLVIEYEYNDNDI